MSKQRRGQPLYNRALSSKFESVGAFVRLHVVTIVAHEYSAPETCVLRLLPMTMCSAAVKKSIRTVTAG